MLSASNFFATDLSMLLFLGLIMVTPVEDSDSVFQNLLRCMQDDLSNLRASEGIPVEPPKSPIASTVLVPFESLYLSLASLLNNDLPYCGCAALTLYTLLRHSASFEVFVLSRSDLDVLLIPLLQKVYEAGASDPNFSSVALVLLIILTQDSTFCSSAHMLILKEVPWYKDTKLSNISLGSLMVVIMVQSTLLHLRSRDFYLVANSLAVLGNSAPQAIHLHAYAARRIVALLDILSRRLLLLQKRQSEVENGNVGSYEDCLHQ